MHRLAATPGGWNNDTEGVIIIEQSPAPIVLLTAADTDISTLSQASKQLPEDFSNIRSVNLLQLQQQLAIDTYAEDVLQHAEIIILRILGGRAYWSYGLEVAKSTAAERNIALVVMPGDEQPDLDLMGHSTVSLSVANELWRYFTEGGINNLCNGLLYISDRVLSTQYAPSKPENIPSVGLYRPPSNQSKRTLSSSHKKSAEQKNTLPFERYRETPPSINENSVNFIQETQQLSNNNSHSFLSTELVSQQPVQNLESSASVGIIFYRAHYLSGNTKVIDEIVYHLQSRNLTAVPIYVSSLKDPDVQQSLIEQCKAGLNNRPVELILNTTSFAIASLTAKSNGSQPSNLWETLDIPILQVICSGSPKSHWQQHPQGLTPRDIAMNVALPEVDGRIITRAVSFKAAQSQTNSPLQTDIVTYEPVSDRVQFVTDLAANWIHLRHTPIQDRKIALILANYPNRDGRLANGVGLDTPASCLEILKAMQAEGYTIFDLPKDGDDLMAQLAAGVTNDPESYGLRPAPQSLSLSDYQTFFESLPAAVQAGITQRWKSPKEEWQRFNMANSVTQPNELPIPGIQLGNVFVGIQPSRGYDIDPTLNYHAPDLAPTHTYMGFYHWLRQHFQADAFVHVGKHGNLEWLPGKGIALSQSCYPEAVFGPMPHLYPFIVNDPGEGAQAKRRAGAVILDHLTPPMTRAELYGPLQQLESLVDEYYEAQNLDPTRLPIITRKIVTLLNTTQLQQDLDLSPQEKELTTWLPQIDGYLCELKEAQIRDGLHIYGQCPQGDQLRDLIVAIARHPNANHIGLSRAIAQTWHLDIDPLTDNLATPFQSAHPKLTNCRTLGDVIEQIEKEAIALIEQRLTSPSPSLPDSPSPLLSVLTWIQQTLLPNLKNTTQEIDNLLRGLNAQYVPSGPSGAPTRNRPEVLPTGRNFYSVDIRAIPTESAWDVGRRAAEILIENYAQENGEYPRTLGLSMWGTAAMRTGGDDMAEALALLGTRPVWDGPSRRVVDFEILPVSTLGRPRVDVTLRISGFFRDAFPNLISLFDQAVKAIAALDEPADQNPLAAQVQQDARSWREKGLNEAQSLERSQYRIFGSKPGAYGAGLQGLIEAQNWDTDADLARAYINWSSYAYTGQADGRSAPEAFSQRLQQMQIVLQNQDNREHDILDSDDYYQFQGGLTAAVKNQSGQAPATYFGDNAVPENPKVRSLSEEIARVYRSRVVNPKWIAGVMRHGYKGAFEMSATIDYLFAYDATTHCVEDHMYQGVAEAYVFDAAVRDFIEQSNPWALRDMSERLLEAHQRGLWKNASEKVVDDLRAIAHSAEGQIETGLSHLSG